MKFVAFLFVLFCCFPYVEIISLGGFDSQPYAFVLGVIIIVANAIKLNKYLISLLFISIWAIIVLFLFGINLDAMRPTCGYISLFVVSYASFIVLKKFNIFTYNLYCGIVMCWFFVGFIQLFLDPYFLSFLLVRGGTGLYAMGGRGVSALSPEPTFYGIVCFLLIFIGWINFNNYPKIRYVMVLLLIQLFILSRSTLVIFSISCGLVLYLFFRVMDFKKGYDKTMFGVFICLFGVILVPFFIYLLGEYRIGQMLSSLWSNPTTFISEDGSLSERFCHIFFSFKGGFENYGIPNGYNSFVDYYIKNVFDPANANIVHPFVLRYSTVTRIMSTLGGMFYELGIFPILAFFYFMLSSYRILMKIKYYAILMIVFIIVLCNAMPFSNGLICFVIGNIIYISDKMQYKEIR